LFYLPFAFDVIYFPVKTPFKSRAGLKITQKNDPSQNIGSEGQFKTRLVQASAQKGDVIALDNTLLSVIPAHQ
jgi:hypothetical protein